MGGSPDPSHGIPGTHTYEYDALGRRVAKIVNDATNNLTNWTLYVSRTEPIAYSPFAGQTLMEYQWTSGQVAAVIRKYTYGSYIDEPITLTDKRVGADNTYYYHRNRQFSTVAMSNTTGQIIERYTYTAYGKPTCYDGTGNTLTTSITGNETTYTGRQSDVETGLMYFRARYYSGELGRFVSRDPIGYSDATNLYVSLFTMYYNVDPSGKFLFVVALAPGAVQLIAGTLLIGVSILIATSPEYRNAVGRVANGIEAAIDGVTEPVSVPIDISADTKPEPVTKPEPRPYPGPVDPPPLYRPCKCKDRFPNLPSCSDSRFTPNGDHFLTLQKRQPHLEE